MKQVIYVDVLLFLNIFITFFLLLTTKIILHKDTPIWRMILGSIFGGACSLLIFMPPLSMLFSVAIKLFSLFIIVLIGLKIQGIKDFLKSLFTFLLMNFVFAGIMFGIWTAFRPQKMIYNNGTVYFNINAGWLILTTIISYIAISCTVWILKKRSPQNSIYEISVSVDKSTVKGYALMDTGSSLKDSFSNIPVVVCDFNFIKPLFKNDMLQFFEGNFPDFKNERNFNIRYIPFGDIGGGGVLPAFMPDEFIIKTRNQKRKIQRIYIAVRNGRLAEGEYIALLSPQIINEETETRNEKIFKKVRR